MAWSLLSNTEEFIRDDDREGISVYTIVRLILLLHEIFCLLDEEGSLELKQDYLSNLTSFCGTVPL